MTGRAADDSTPKGAAESTFELLAEPEPEDGPLLPSLDSKSPPAPISITDVVTDVIDVDVDLEGDRESLELPPRPLRVFAVAGARGGVGKTVLAANIALYLSTIGRRVVLVDADVAGASLHSTLGTRSGPALSRIKRGGSETDGGAIPTEALFRTPFPGLTLLHAGLDDPTLAAPRPDRMVKLIERLRTLEADVVVIDMGVGASKELVDGYLATDLGVFVTLPEPTAIENTYRFIRAAFARYLMAHTPNEEHRDELERRMRVLGGTPPPRDLYDDLAREQHALTAHVGSLIEAFRPSILVNQTRLRSDLQLGQAMQSVVRRRMGVLIDYVGYVDHDDTVWTCVRNRKPVLLEVPGAKASKKIEKLARRILLMDAGKVPRASLPRVPANSHHDLLEVDRGATDDEIRRAYKRAREVYAHDALCCYGLLDPHEIEKIRTRLDEAFDVLLDSARRRPYELSVFPPDSPMAPEEPAAEDMDAEARPAPEISPDTQFTGSLLRQVREAQRVGLRDISLKTKINLAYLRAIEEEDFSKLPAVVYATGFVAELARTLKLDPQHVSRTYIMRYKRFLSDKEKGFVPAR